MLDWGNGEERLNKFLGSEKKTTILYDGTLHIDSPPIPIIKSAVSTLRYNWSKHSCSCILWPPPKWGGLFYFYRVCRVFILVAKAHYQNSICYPAI